MTARIEAALDTVLRALREGRLEQLPALTDDLDAALADLGACDGAMLRRLSAKAARNALVLRAAAQGVKAAQRRLADIRSVRQGFVSYGPSGERDGTAGATQLAQRI